MAALKESVAASEEGTRERTFSPTTPETAPPKKVFQISSPEGPPPPRSKMVFHPSTPEGTPPERMQFASATPDHPPPPRMVKDPSDTRYRPSREKEVTSPLIPAPPRAPKQISVIKHAKPPSREGDVQKQLEQLISIFWDEEAWGKTSKTIAERSKSNELEVRFGTMGIKNLTKIDYDNVIQKLISLGFVAYGAEAGSYLLRAYPKAPSNADKTDKSVAVDNDVRVEIRNLHTIQEYCKLDNLQKLMDAHHGDSINFQTKSAYRFGGSPLVPVNFDDFNFRVSFQVEEDLKRTSKTVESVCKTWQTLDKTYRYINRLSLRHPDYPIQVDFSITKSVFGGRKKMSRVSEVFSAPETYEIELEVINEEIGTSTATTRPEELLSAVRKVVKMVLMGMQRTNYPVSYVEQAAALTEYMQIIRGSEYRGGQIYSSDFIGPGTATLQIENICQLNPDILEPNIRQGYTVTDKADGDRALLLVSHTGRMYLITTNMEAIFTGAVTKSAEAFDTIVDGELILHDREGRYINLFAAFDIYFTKGKNIRSLAFMSIGETRGQETRGQEKTRINLLNEFMQKLSPVSVVPGATHSPMTFVAKEFRYSENIFDTCKAVLEKEQDAQYRYNTDGIIFTPALMGVGSDRVGSQGKLSKMTWSYSFKWKPPKYNTIDFLVTTIKGPNGVDKVTPIFQGGIDVSKIAQVEEYKTLILRCGYRTKDGFMNPCLDIMNDTLPKKFNPSVKDDSNEYKPVQFYPTNPADQNAGIAKIILRMNGSTKQMYTEEGEVFEDNMIVEFRRDLEEPNDLFRWKPLRVRYDKTAEYRQGLPNFGNSYFVANKNWKSIHNPIDKDMLTTGNNIPDEIANDDIYYNKVTHDTLTRGLRDFHNLFVKRMLIHGVTRKGNTLLDFACGKAGDLAKWTKAELSFVFGIDISSDNLENRTNGACARYLQMYRQTRNMPDVLFVNGDSSLNVRSGEAMRNEKAVQVTKTVFGSIRKNAEAVGAGVIRQYAVGEAGFDVTSCQFAIHYFFENITTLQNFARNVAECTKIHGYFIGTTYDGRTIFDKLYKTQMGKSLDIYHQGTKVWEVEKKYEEKTFPADSSSLGYTVGVYQESIGKKMDEYLVNYDYLVRVMANYGLSPVSRDEARTLGFGASTGMFREMYDTMVHEIKRNPSTSNVYGSATRMQPYEQDISFLNRYFIFKKTHVVNAAKVSLESIGEQLPKRKRDEDEEKEKGSKAASIVKSIPPKYATKLNRKIILVQSEITPSRAKRQVITLSESSDEEEGSEGEKFEKAHEEAMSEEGEKSGKGDKIEEKTEQPNAEKRKRGTNETNETNEGEKANAPEKRKRSQEHTKKKKSKKQPEIIDLVEDEDSDEA